MIIEMRLVYSIHKIERMILYKHHEKIFKRMRIYYIISDNQSQALIRISILEENYSLYIPSHPLYLLVKIWFHHLNLSLLNFYSKYSNIYHHMIPFDHLSISTIDLILFSIHIHFISIVNPYLDCTSIIFVLISNQNKSFQLTLSDETIPYQVSIWKEYYSLFHEQFIHLQSLSLIEIFDEKLHLPASVKTLEIRKYDTYQYIRFDFTELIEKQAKMLNHLKIDRIGALNYVNTPFPALTHLIIDGGYNLDSDSYIAFSDQYENVDATSIFQRLGCSITHLHLFIDRENQTMKIDLQQFSHCLTHLILHYFDGKNRH